MHNKTFGLFLVVCFLSTYYLLLYLVFIKPTLPANFPVLAKRFGSLVHTAATNPGDEMHTYCYYPGANINYFGKGNEYILKQVANYKDCQGWYGIFEIAEKPGLSNKDKII